MSQASLPSQQTAVQDRGLSLTQWLAEVVNRLLDGEADLLTVPEAHEWVAAKLWSRRTVADWVAIGVRVPDQIPEGLNARDAMRLRALKVAPAPQWAGVGRTCPIAHRTLAEVGKDVRETIALTLALDYLAFRGSPPNPLFGTPGDPECPCGQVTSHHEAAAVVAECAADFDWADLTAYLRAGLRPGEALDHVRSGQDMGPLRVMLALA